MKIIKKTGKKMVKKKRLMVWLVIAAAVFVTGTAAFWHWIGQPCVFREDVRGKGIYVEDIKRLEEEEKDGAMGILRIAGWRTEKEQSVFSVSTGRKERAEVIGVYGPMELMEDRKGQIGRLGLDVEGEYCVLSEKLARDLFGSTDILGEWVGMGKRKFLVVGVTKKEETVLWIPIGEGEVEMLAVEMDSRLRNGAARVREIVTNITNTGQP